MPADPTTLARAVRSTEHLMLRFLDGFDEQNRATQGPSLPNHACWILGHCALTMQRAADLVAGYNEAQPLPASDWVTGDGGTGDPSRFDTESVAVGSTPQADPVKYPRLDRAIEIYKVANARLAETIEAASPQALDREVRWGSTTLPAAELVSRVLFHNGTHCGQLTDLRRALGLKRALG